jgi:hypothetical protein
LCYAKDQIAEEILEPVEKGNMLDKILRAVNRNLEENWGRFIAPQGTG